MTEHAGAGPDVAIVLGGADCVWEDYAEAREMAPSAAIIAVNDIGAFFPDFIQHWVTLHPEKLVGVKDPHHNPHGVHWQEMRQFHGYPATYTTWSRRNPEYVDEVLEHWGSGSSGLYAVTVAFHVGCEKVILCGVPMDERPHFEGSVGVEEDGVWTEWELHRKKWRDVHDRLEGRVRSMSGWTMQRLGAPNTDWLNDRDESWRSLGAA